VWSFPSTTYNSARQIRTEFRLDRPASTIDRLSYPVNILRTPGFVKVTLNGVTEGDDSCIEEVVAAACLRFHGFNQSSPLRGRPGQLLLLVIVISSHSTPEDNPRTHSVLLWDQLAVILNEPENSHRFSPLSPFKSTRKPSNTTHSPASERPSPALLIQQPPPDHDAFKLQLTYTSILIRSSPTLPIHGSPCQSNQYDDLYGFRCCRSVSLQSTARYTERQSNLARRRSTRWWSSQSSCIQPVVVTTSTTFSRVFTSPSVSTPAFR
jgi:hypothetical protein